MQISWALILNHLNCLNLRNCSISQSINRGLGEGINRMNLGEQSYAGGISSKVFGAEKLKILWLHRSPCLRRWVVHLSHSLIVNKENYSSNFVLSLFHVLGFDEYIWLSTIYVVYLPIIYTCIRSYLDNLLFAGEGGASLKALERSRAEQDKSWINRR